MIVKVVRKIFTDKSTIGEMFVNNVFLCYTLEDKDRGLKQTDSLIWIKTHKIFVGIMISNDFQILLSDPFKTPFKSFQ